MIKMNEELINPDAYELKATPIFKLKDNPPKRQVQMINLKGVFGTIPDMIGVRKVRGANNKFIVYAFLPRENIKGKDNKV